MTSGSLSAPRVDLSPPFPTAKVEKSFSRFSLRQSGHEAVPAPITSASKRREHRRQTYS